MGRYGFYVLFILISSGCNNLQENNTSTKGADNTSISSQQSKLIFENGKHFPDGTQVSIAIIKNGKVSFSGIVCIRDSVYPYNNQQKVFEIGSITKVFTSTLLSNLILENKVGIDDTINGHLPFELKNNIPITFKQLANHTSGLPRLPTNFTPKNPANPYADYDKEKLKDYLSNDLELSASPGFNYEYSNLGFGLLGYALCQVENESFDQLLKQKIFTKFRMNNTTSNRGEIEHLLIPGRDEYGVEVLNWDLDILEGAGSLLSTTEDLSKFVVAHFDDSNKELSLTRKMTFTINNISGMGLSWEIINRKFGDTWYKHNGRTGGYSSSMAFDVDKKNGIIILSNISAFSSLSDNINNLCFSLMNTMEH